MPFLQFNNTSIVSSIVKNYNDICRVVGDLINQMTNLHWSMDFRQFQHRQQRFRTIISVEVFFFHHSAQMVSIRLYKRYSSSVCLHTRTGIHLFAGMQSEVGSRWCYYTFIIICCWVKMSTLWSTCDPPINIDEKYESPNYSNGCILYYA